MNFGYYTCCVDSTAELIDEMVERSIKITWKTFKKHIHLSDLQDLFPFYAWEGKGLKLKDDWAVSFYKSVYDGKDCYYIYHSAIEYIFVR